MHWQLVAVFDTTANFVDVGKIKARVDALGIQVERQRDQPYVARTFAVSEQAAFYAIGAGHDGELGSGHGGAAAVMRVHAEHNAVAASEMTRQPFDLAC